MKRVFSGVLAVLSAASAVASGAFANDCASANDLAALHMAALQQELMVAAFSCHDVDLYNRFVTTHQPELIESDAKLKAFFVRRDTRHSEAGYHTYKTELANASSLRYLHDDGFCADAGSAFQRALQPASLADVAEAGPDDIAPVYQACPGAMPLMRTADTQSPARAAFVDQHHDFGTDDHAGRPPRLTPVPPLDPEEDHVRGTAQITTPATHREIDDGP